MTRRAFDVRDIVEILMHWHAGRPMAVVARSLGVDRGTVAKYVSKAQAAGLHPGGPPLPRDQWAMLVHGWFPELVDPRHRSLTHAAIDAHRDRIEGMLGTNTVTTVHQRLRDEHGLAVGLTSFRRYVWREFPEDRARALATPPRPEVPPGEEGQIDYGFLGTWFDPALERLRRVWAFVMVLAHSRHMFVRPVLKMDQRSWVAAHVAAFRFFSGAPRRLVSDEHHMQQQALRWCTEVAGVRSHRSLEGASPLAVFEAAEAAALIPLPPSPFELATWSRPKVGPDCHVKVGKVLYSVPWRFIGTEVDAREGERTVEIYSGGEIVKTHHRVERGKQTDWHDFPPEKVAFFMRTPQWCLKRASELGPSVNALVEGLLAGGALYRMRQAQGVITLAERHADRLDAACRRALEVGDATYRTVKGILRAGTEDEGAPEPPHAEVPAHLHGPLTLFDDLDEQEVAG